MTKKKKRNRKVKADIAPASAERSDRPGSDNATEPRGPRPRSPLTRHRVSISFPSQGRTRQSMKDECDPNLIVDRFARTGQIVNVHRTKPQYGDAPDQTLFEAACVQAELRSKDQEGALDALDEKTPEKPSEALSDEKPADPGETPESGEKPAQDERSGEGL